MAQYPAFEAPPSGSFLEKLRMNNLFPVGGGPQTYGMPDLNSGGGGGDIEQMYRMIQRGKDREMQRQLNLDNEMRRRNAYETMSPQEILTGKRDPRLQQQQQMPFGVPNVSLGEDSNPGARILNPPVKDRELEFKQQQLSQKGTIEAQKLAGQQQTRNIQQQRADTYDWKARNPNGQVKQLESGNLLLINPATGETREIAADTFTDREKQELIGGQRMEQIGAQGANQRQLQEMRGSQAIEQIGARILGQQEVNAARPMMPSQIGNEQENRIRQVMLTRPELAQYIVMDSSGRPSISQDAPITAISEIQRAVYGNSPEILDKSGKPTDVKLPSGSTTPAARTTTPKATTPTAATSKYKVTVE